MISSITNSSILSYIQMLRKNQSPGLNQQSQLPPQSNVLILIFDMTRTLVQLLLTLSTLILQTLAGGCQLKEPDAFEHRPLLGQRWACEDPQLQFPTVACLARDILTCGKVKDNWCVFYSMGAKGSDAQDYANEDLNGRGVTLHMAFD